MFIRSLGNAFDKARTSARFAAIVRRRMRLTNEASAPGGVPGELMQDAYAKATGEIASKIRSFGRSGARPPLKLPSTQRMKPAG